MIVVWTEPALENLAGINQYISQTSSVYAEQMLRRSLDRGKQLEAFPESGRMTSDMPHLICRAGVTSGRPRKPPLSPLIGPGERVIVPAGAFPDG